MARLRIALLKWGGIAICVIVAIDLILIYWNVFAEFGLEPAGPVGLYWVLLFVGVAATILANVFGKARIGLELHKRKSQTHERS